MRNREALDRLDGHVTLSTVIAEEQQSQEKGCKVTKKKSSEH